MQILYAVVGLIVMFLVYALLTHPFVTVGLMLAFLMKPVVWLIVIIGGASIACLMRLKQ